MGTNRKFKWWMIPIAVLLAAAVLLAVFWDSVSVYLAPKTVLTAALKNTWSALETRFSGSPLLVLGKALDASGRNTIQMELDTTNDLLGDIQYNMTVQTQLSPKRILAEGTATTSGNILDLSLYLDGDFAAVSSDSLLEGNFYGITYDTFSQDIRSNYMLSFLLGDETISEWEASVTSLQEQMSGSIAIPEISEEDISMAMMGVLALKADVSREVVELSGAAQECFLIRFEATGAQIIEGMQLAQMELPFTIGADDLLTASFYLAEDRVVKCSFDLTGAEELHISLVPGIAPGTDDINVSYTHQTESYGATISTTGNESVYTEAISFRETKDGIRKDSVIRYNWDHTNGNLQLILTQDGTQTALKLNLTGTEDGFKLATDDFDALMSVLTDGEDNADNPCTMTVTKGADFSTPVYKNFDQWSMEDILTLLGSIGSLFGLQFG